MRRLRAEIEARRDLLDGVTLDIFPFEYVAVVGRQAVQRDLSLGKPFFSLDSRRATGGRFATGSRVDSLYDRGEAFAEFRHDVQDHEFHTGWSRGLDAGWSRRIVTGFAFEDHAFAPLPGSTLPVSVVPDDRRFLYPFIEFEAIEDRFEATRNIDQIGRTEDRFLGTRYSLRLGYSGAGMGSTETALHIKGAVGRAFSFREDETVLLGVDLGGRLHNGAGRNVLLSGHATYHGRHSARHLFYASLSGTLGRDLDIDQQILLGGDNGLRGYPLRYQAGDSRLLLTLEHRVYTDWYLFRLFHVGAAVFFDAGRTWGNNAAGSSSLGWLRNVGAGLRLGNTRSSVGRVLHVDLAFPPDGEDSIESMQVILQAKRSF